MGTTSTGTINFGGLASGLDTQSILESLVNIKNLQIVTPIQEKIELLKARQNAMAPLISSIQSFSQTAKEFNNPLNSIWETKSASSSDASYITVTTLNSQTSTVGNTVISDVSQLAQPDRVIFEGKADSSSSNWGAGTISITYDGSTRDIDIASDDSTLIDIAAAINNEDMGVRASIINDGGATPYRLVLTSSTTGEDTDISVNVTGVSLTVDNVLTNLAVNQAQNAMFKVNGIDVESASNSVTNAIQGVSFNLLQTNSTSDVVIKVSQNTASIVTKITNFVSAYESLRTSINTAINKDPETDQYGPLAFDITFSSAALNLSNIMATKFRSLAGYEYSSLAEIGISRDIKGKIQIDTPTLTRAIEQNVEDVKKLFDGSTNEDGITEKMFTFADGLVNASGTLTSKNRELTHSKDYYEKLIKERKAMVVQYQDRMAKKFAALEVTMNKLKANESKITSFFDVYSQNSNKLL
ncbi:flagellar filament capping protein FliD [bacterium]|nr:flagellar filament capping protein FliD [bacterium]